MGKGSNDRPESRSSEPGLTRFTRRTLLSSAAAVTSAAILPSGFAAVAFPGLGMSATKSSLLPSEVPAHNPSWYGFNLLEYFSTDPDWMEYFPYKNDGMFLEDDFRWMRDWGFNFVRLPMDYRFWTDAQDLMKINEKKVEPIDRAIRLGEKYGVHINISLHRAPGFCVLDDLDPVLTGIHVTPEKLSFNRDRAALEAFVHQWTFFAHRYKGISSERVSFNLVNEPYLTFAAEEKAQLEERRKREPKEAIDHEIEVRGAREYARVARAAIDGIRAVDPQRLITSDGSSGGVTTVADLFSTGVLQSSHDYYPGELTHFQCEWARAWVKGTEPPTWPLKDSQGKVTLDQNSIANFVQPWRGLEQQGVPIHFGEMGCYKHTPPEVVLAWFSDTLDALSELKSGWALWNFRGPFGVLDTERPGTKFEDWQGHQLDRPLLTLLQKKMKA